MKRWLVMGALVMLALALAVVGCAREKPPREIVNLEFYPGGPIGTGAYEIGLAISAMLNDLHPWLKATVIESTGSTDAVHAADAPLPERRKNCFVICVPNPDAVKARLGIPPYKRKFEDLTWIATSTPVGFGFGTYNPEIRTPQDLIGKRLGVFPKGSALETLSDALLKDAWGIYDKVRLSPHSPMDFKDLMLTGVNDATFFVTIEPLAGGKWAMSSHCVLTLGVKQAYWIPVTREDIDRINQKHPWDAAWFLVPKGAAGKNAPPEDCGLISTLPSIMLWDTADEEIVYELVKFLDENAEEYTRRLQGRLMGKGSQMAKLPLGITEGIVHPGARRYYEEQGMRIEPWEAL